MKFSKSISFISPFGYPLLLSEGQGPGGAERQFFIFGKELVAQGWGVSFITEYPATEYKQQKTVLPAYHCSFSYLGGSNLRLPMDWLSLYRAMRKADSDYYVIKVPGHLLAPMVLFCRLLKKKLVFWGQMTFDADPSLRNVNSLIGWLQDWGIKHTDIIIAQTKEQQNGFLRNYGLKSSVVPSICAKLLSDYSSSAINNLCEDVDVLWAGNSAFKKRYEVVVELAKLMPETNFALAMNISDKERFVQAERNCRGLKNLIFLGMVPPRMMEDIFLRTKIFLNTSTQEGFPNTYLQSWMNGIPVVSLNIDPDNVISENGLGRVVGRQFADNRIDSYEYLALQLKPYISELLDLDCLRADLGEKAKEYIASNHLPEKVLPKLISTLL